jgi:centrin-1
VEEGRSEIDFTEFLDLMTQRVSNKDTREDLKKVFNFFDLDKTGFISIKNLKAIVKELGENIDEHELQEMIQKADQDQDGQVSEEEFYNIMTRKGPRV